MVAKLQAQPYFPSLGFPTLTAELYHRLKHDIVTCRLRPGKLVFQSDLMRDYQAGKTPVREALKLLTQEGLIRPLASRGHLVTLITLEDARELFALRQVLESASMRLAAARVTEAQLDELVRLAGLPLALDNAESRIRWYIQNVEFHSALAAVGSNQRLVRVLRSVMEDLTRLFLLDLERRADTSSMVGGHLRVIEALRRRDAEAAVAVLEEEAARSLELIEASVASSPGDELPAAGKVESVRRLCADRLDDPAPKIE